MLILILVGAVIVLIYVLVNGPNQDVVQKHWVAVFEYRRAPCSHSFSCSSQLPPAIAASSALSHAGHSQVAQDRCKIAQHFEDSLEIGERCRDQIAYPCSGAQR